MRSAVAALAFLALAACHSGQHVAESTALKALRGRVQATGVDAFTDVTLVVDSSHQTLQLRGPQTSLLLRADGLGVIVIGTRAGSAFDVVRFMVVSANGIAALDGILGARGAELYLTTVEHVEHRLVRPSPVLRAHVGSRVWIAGPPNAEAVSYGIIE